MAARMRVRHEWPLTYCEGRKPDTSDQSCRLLLKRDLPAVVRLLRGGTYEAFERNVEFSMEAADHFQG